MIARWNTSVSQVSLVARIIEASLRRSKPLGTLGISAVPSRWRHRLSRCRRLPVLLNCLRESAARSGSRGCLGMGPTCRSGPGGLAGSFALVRFPPLDSVRSWSWRTGRS
ncbi:hypothetical protein U1Q18_044812 [Sarracenia purpurea var. burkii]